MFKKPYHLKTGLLAKPPKNGHYYIVAIDGRGGAGKTTLSKYLKGLLPDFQLICGDDYFEPITHPIAWGGYNERRFNKDIIKPLKETSLTINYRPYDWDNLPHVKDNIITIDKGLLVDRCYIFSFNVNYDLKIWLETPREETIIRGISRSSMPKQKAEVVWRELWKPMEDIYINKIKPLETADLIIYGDKPYEDQIVYQ